MGPESQFFSTSCQQRQSISTLLRATVGSAGLDLCSTAYTVLTPDMGVQALPTGIYGPLPADTFGLIVGRSSSTMEGLMIHPGVIDSDYTGEIEVMASSPKNINTIPNGSALLSCCSSHY